MKQETIKASEFKAKCLRLLGKVRDTGKEIIISKNGAPVSELVPIKKKSKTLFCSHMGQVITKADIVSPLEVDWDAMR